MAKKSKPPGNGILGLTIGCTIKELPEELQMAAAADAVLENPANAPLAALSANVFEPQRLAVMTQKYWGSKGVDLTVSFLDNPNAATRTKILAYAKQWGKHGNIVFRETASGGDIRIARENDGYWSYLGTDIKQIGRNKATMNLQGFTDRTSDAEYSRVVVHEFGHTLGFPHEHARPDIVALLDEAKVIAYFKRNQGWSESMVRSQILTPLSERSLLGSRPEVGSIMCYDFPASVTKANKAIIGGATLTPTDGTTTGQLYPKSIEPTPPPVEPPAPAGKASAVVTLADGRTIKLVEAA